MKLVVTHLGALSRYVTREFYYIITDLIETYGWQKFNADQLRDRPGTIERTLLDEFGELPKSILFWETFNLLGARRVDVYRLECKKYIFADDLYWWTDEVRLNRSAGYALFDTVLSAYAYEWDECFPEFAGTKRLVWIPHSASPDFMLPYNPHAENAVLLSGHIGHYNPLRAKMKLLCEQGSYAITHYAHPGYMRSYDYSKDEEVGRGYAEKLNKYRAGFTDAYTYKYVVAKYLEIPATGSLLLGDDAVRGPLEQLGFVDNTHYVAVSRKNLEEKLHYVLDQRNHEELDEIRRRGQELVWQKHKTSDRARAIDEVCA